MTFHNVYNSSIQITYNNSTELILNLNSINEYICPICLKIFNKKDIDLLSKEHVPPESVGGKIICLTCIPCNTKFGSKIEGSISDYFKSIEFDDIFFSSDNNVTKRKTKINKSISSSIEKNNGNIIIKIDEKNSNPFEVKNFFNQLKKTGYSELKFKNPHPINSDKINLSLLKSAYLYFFSNIGYNSLMWSSFKLIRDQINNPTIDQINGFNFIINQNFEDSDLGISIIIKDNINYGYLVVLRINNENVGIALPYRDDDNLSLYKLIFNDKIRFIRKINCQPLIK